MATKSNGENTRQWPAPGTSGGGPSIPTGNPVTIAIKGKVANNAKVWGKQPN